MDMKHIKFQEIILSHQ